MKPRSYKPKAKKSKKPVKRVAAGRAPVRRRSNLKVRRSRVVVPRKVAGGLLTASSAFLPSYHGKLATPQVAKAIKMIGSPNTSLEQDSLLIDNLQGFQQVRSTVHLPIEDLVTIRNHITNTIKVPIRFVVESYQTELTMTNSSTVPCEVELWDLVLRKDLPQAFSYEAVTGQVYPTQPTPEAYWYNGSLMAADLPLGTPTAQAPFYRVASSPFDSQLFAEFYEVKKRTIITMPMGTTHRHVVFMKPNYLVKDAEIQTKGIQYGIKGLTAFTMIRMNGFPTGGLTGSLCYAASQLSLMQSSRIKYTWAQDVGQNVYLNAVEPFASVVDIVNTGSGQIEPPTYVG